MTSWYRYYTTSSGVHLDSFTVVKTTPKGVWLDNKKFILRDARKRWACPTKPEARESFIARKRVHIRILKKQLQLAEQSLAAAESGQLPDHLIFETEDLDHYFSKEFSK